MLKIVGKPGWWIILFMIPGVNLIVLLVMISNLATVFGKGGGYGAGMLFLPFIFYPMLAFGDAEYVGPRRRGRSVRSRLRAADEDFGEAEDDDRVPRRKRKQMEDEDDDRDRISRRSRADDDDQTRRRRKD
jgi:hypothetical protein